MNDITKVDRNFAVETHIDKEDIRFYDAQQTPFKIYGIYFEDGKFRRIPEAVANSIQSDIHLLHANTAGGRVRFRTDSSYVAIHMKTPRFYRLPHFPLTGTIGFDLYADGQFVKTFVPPIAVEDGYESVIELGSSEMREITIHCPLYGDVSELYIGVSEKAGVFAPKAYATEKPIVYYGSSITQGGCASRPGNAYTNILSRRLNVDHINLGFSGKARGEAEMAEYIKDLDMTAFVYDYDHNAPDCEHLQNTHERMFQIIRQANPDLPIVMMSRPKYALTDEEIKRLEIIKTTYKNAKESGDKNVYFIEGPALMELAQNDGTVDGCHPNDLGFASMAKALGDVLEGILNK